MTVDLLLPTRGRPELLARSLRSLSQTANPRNLRLYAAVDADDPTLPETQHALWATNIDTHVWVVPDRYGYHRMEKYYNELARRGYGQWILLWNDDATMLNTGWDDQLAALPPDVLVAEFDAQLYPHHLTFPAVRRELVRQVGGFSPHTSHADTYWQIVGRTLGVARSLQARIHHDRYDLTGNNNDQTYQETRNGYRTVEFYGQQIQDLIAADIETIRGWITDRKTTDGS